MQDSEEAQTPAPTGKQGLIFRVTFCIFLQLLLALVCAVLTGQFLSVQAWLQTKTWLLGVLLFLLFSLLLLTRFLNHLHFRGVLGVVILSVFTLMISAIIGAWGVAWVSPATFIIGTGLLSAVTCSGLLYLGLAGQGEFKAHVVIPIGLMISLGLYGALMIALHSSYTPHLMLWTFVEAGFIIYFSLVLQEFQQKDDLLQQEDYCVGTLRVYSDIAVFLFSSLSANKSITKPK